MATLGAVKLVNTREDEAVPVEVTSYPVEVGAAITDHVQQQNKTLSVTGFLLGKTAEQDYKKLRDYAQKGTIISYKGRVYYSSILINQVTKGYDTIENGMEITVSITTLRRATTPWVQKKKTSSGKKQTSNTKKAAGTYITVKKGDCYWKWWKRYGTSIAQLRAWNKWPDRRIPIGKRARVK